MMNANPSFLRRLAGTRLFWPLLALALMLAFNLFFTKGFFHD